MASSQAQYETSDAILWKAMLICRNYHNGNAYFGNFTSVQASEILLPILSAFGKGSTPSFLPLIQSSKVVLELLAFHTMVDQIMDQCLGSNYINTIYTTNFTFIYNLLSRQIVIGAISLSLELPLTSLLLQINHNQSSYTCEKYCKVCCAITRIDQINQ